MDLQRDAARLVTIATVFVWVGWLSILYALIAGVLWWIDLPDARRSTSSRRSRSPPPPSGPDLPGADRGRTGSTLPLFALYVASKSQ